MELRPYINWMQRFTIYETLEDIYIVGSDVTEKYFRVPPSEASLSSDQSTPPSDPNSSISEPSFISIGSHQPLTKSLTGVGLIGFIRFLFGYYLIVITQRREVARIGEHRIYKIEDTKMVYIPKDAPITSAPDDSGNIKSMQSDESRFLRMFQGVELNRGFYFSYTYDLTRSLQVNMEPFGVMGNRISVFDKPMAFRSVPDSRFLWNFPLIPPRYHPTSATLSDWFIGLIHGFVKQASLVSCGMPVTVSLLARRSRFFAGTRFLKRGANIDGNVANEVETEQIVCDTSEPNLSRMRVSSMVQHRGSVPLFWSQDTARLMVGKPPLEITWMDPYYEAFGKHFADLIERHGIPIVVLNLMKQQEKRRFEQELTAGFLEGIEYLNQFAPELKSTNSPTANKENLRPITYVNFDMAQMKRSPDSFALDRLLHIAEECIRSTGIFFSAGLKPVSDTVSREDYIERTHQLMGSDVCPRQHGIIRANCVDCVDRTNTAQFVLGHVAVAFQLRAIGLLDDTHLSFDSTVSKVLRDLFEEHGDTLALQYGGSGVVHNIETYRNPSTSRVSSRDIMQTLSRYYSNNFIDFEKQLATDLFLRVFRPGAGPPDAEWGPDPGAIAATSSVRAGLAFLLSSDPAFEAYMHWLSAWASIPPYRASLGAWFPFKAFRAQQMAMRGWDTSISSDHTLLDDAETTTDELKLKLIELNDNDPGNDWYSELYRPHDWMHFYDLRYHQLPLVVSTISPSRENPSVQQSSSNLPAASTGRQSQVHLAGGFSSKVLTTIEEDEEESNYLTCLTINPQTFTANGEHAVDTAANQSTASGHSRNTEEGNACPDGVSKVSETQSTVSKIYQLRAAAASVASKSKSEEALFPSSDGSVATSTIFGEIGEQTAPLPVKFSQVRLSELAERVEKRGNDESSRSQESLSDEEEEEPEPVGDRRSPFSRMSRRYELSSTSSPIKLRKPSKRDMEKYRKYASIPLTSMYAPLSEVLTVDPASMKIYENTVKLARTGVCSIPTESLQVYQKFTDVKRFHS
ncbi:hypothetical protein Aperf_G00000011160 [Anoplocephala perfoliata]